MRLLYRKKNVSIENSNKSKNKKEKKTDVPSHDIRSLMPRSRSSSFVAKKAKVVEIV